MKNTKKSTTAAELMARLQADPDWVLQNAERGAAHNARLAQRLKEIETEEAPILAELANAGVKVRSNLADRLGLEPESTPVRTISDLVNTRDSYPEAIPILAKHLERLRHPIMVESTARALTVKESRGTDAPTLILEKLKQTDPCPAQSGDAYDARWALANALTVVGDENMVEEIKSLIADPGFADVRDRLKDALRHCERLAK